MCSVSDCRVLPSYWIAAFFRGYFLPVLSPPPPLWLIFFIRKWIICSSPASAPLAEPGAMCIVKMNHKGLKKNNPKQTHNPEQTKKPHHQTHAKIVSTSCTLSFSCDFWRFWEMQVSCLQMVTLELTVSLLQSHYLLDWRIRYGDECPGSNRWWGDVYKHALGQAVRVRKLERTIGCRAGNSVQRGWERQIRTFSLLCVRGTLGRVMQDEH